MSDIAGQHVTYKQNLVMQVNQSINQGLFIIQTNNNNNDIHTFQNMNTERAGNEVYYLYKFPPK